MRMHRFNAVSTVYSGRDRTTALPYYAAKARLMPTPKPTHAVLQLLRATLLEAWRTRLLLIWVGFILVAVFVASFGAQLALIENARFRLVWLGVGLRLAALALLTFFLASSLLRERDERRVEFVLGFALARRDYLLAKLLAAAVLGAVFAASAAGVLLLADGRVAIWMATLWLELVLVAALAIFASITLSSIAAALSFVFAFYLLARMWPGLVYLSSVSPFADQYATLGAAARVFGMLLPRVDLYARSEWLLGSAEAGAPLAILHAFAYILLLLSAAMVDLRRREI